MTVLIIHFVVLFTFFPYDINEQHYPLMIYPYKLGVGRLFIVN